MTVKKSCQMYVILRELKRPLESFYSNKKYLKYKNTIKYKKFPDLAKIARDYLCIMPTSAPSEEASQLVD